MGLRLFCEGRMDWLRQGDLLRPFLHSHWHPSASNRRDDLPAERALPHSPQLPLPLANVEPLFSPNALNLFGVDLRTFSLHQSRYPTVTIPWMTFAECDDSLSPAISECRLTPGPIIARTGHTQCSTRLGNASQSLLHTRSYRPTPGRRAYHFFEFTSLRI